MRHFTEEEIEFVKEQLEKEIPKKRFLKSILHTDLYTFKRMCAEVNIDYPAFKCKKFRNNPFENINNPNVQY